MRLFLYYYAIKPDVDWACAQVPIARVTYTKTWLRQKRFRDAWNAVVRGDVIDTIRAHASDQAAKSFDRIIELRDQNKNLRVALEAAKSSLRAVRDPTFASQLNVTKDVGANWMRVLQDLAPQIHALSRGDIVEASDWEIVNVTPPQSDVSQTDLIDVEDWEIIENPKLLESKEDTESEDGKKQ